MLRLLGRHSHFSVHKRGVFQAQKLQLASVSLGIRAQEVWTWPGKNLSTKSLHLLHQLKQSQVHQDLRKRYLREFLGAPLKSLHQPSNIFTKYVFKCLSYANVCLLCIETIRILMDLLLLFLLLILLFILVICITKTNTKPFSGLDKKKKKKH